MGKFARNHAFELLKTDTPQAPFARFDMERITSAIGFAPGSSDSLAASLPYAAGDVTAGCENELQTAVRGPKHAVDLPRTILESNYFENIRKRAAAGETHPRALKALEDLIDRNSENVWENAWVRFHRAGLNAHANNVFETDLLSDKKVADEARRSDLDRFVLLENGEPFVRIPMSYLLKLALADVAGEPDTPPLVRTISRRYMGHFLNDNTSPETFSFYPVPLEPSVGMGKGIADETLTRFLLCQALGAYANQKFGLAATGQEAMIYFAPNPPIRQKNLNELIPDAFYRELFMSPCLSGWDRGEDKYQYMNLCHQVLSRSQLNAVKKLREADIINNNLVVLPNTSNISLANNGTHISLGSRKLTALLKAGDPRFTPTDEKYLGDLSIKIIEHFLPLFVGTYSAAPYRLAFSDFHPEKALGFLPHELDFTHLRMIWRRWKKKADLKILGKPFTPFGPEWLDRTFSTIFRLKGDFIHDFRLIDYFSSLMSTDRSPALDGTLGNDVRLLKDLASMGVFDNCMSLYLLYRNRSFDAMGFTGFEGRYYSQFESINADMGHAANLQTLLSALAFKYMLTGQADHRSIPDDPTVESERRQIFFGSAIGLPTFFIHKNTPNRFMLKILRKTANTRFSSRYPGYIRVHHIEYKRALLAVLREDAADLIESMGLSDTIDDLSLRINCWSTHSAAGRLTRRILDQAGAKTPLSLPAGEFNAAAECYYQGRLRIRHMEEGFDSLLEHAKSVDRGKLCNDSDNRQALDAILNGRSAWEYLDARRERILKDLATVDELRVFIGLLVVIINGNSRKAETAST